MLLLEYMCIYYAKIQLFHTKLKLSKIFDITENINLN